LVPSEESVRHAAKRGRGRSRVAELEDTAAGARRRRARPRVTEASALDEACAGEPSQRVIQIASAALASCLPAGWVENEPEAPDIVTLGEVARLRVEARQISRLGLA